MYITDSSNISINLIFLGEGSFKWNQVSGQPLPEVELVMGIGNEQTRETYGSCKVTSSLLSQETVEKFMEFVKSAEEDYGEVLFRGVKPQSTAIPGTAKPEVQTGLGGK
jgi:hypothetical protein